jgi:hypothetical protein
VADEIRQVAIATVSPTCCVRCQSHVGPFADIDVEHFDVGQLYLCKLCIDGAIRAMGGCTREERADLETRLADCFDRIDALRGDVAEAKRAAVSDFADFLHDSTLERAS